LMDGCPNLQVQPTQKNGTGSHHPSCGRASSTVVRALSSEVRLPMFQPGSPTDEPVTLDRCVTATSLCFLSVKWDGDCDHHFCWPDAYASHVCCVHAPPGRQRWPGSSAFSVGECPTAGVTLGPWGMGAVTGHSGGWAEPTPCHCGA
jgi:hypothetical protein